MVFIFMDITMVFIPEKMRLKNQGEKLTLPTMQVRGCREAFRFFT
jgi:hypothetical protein